MAKKAATMKQWLENRKRFANLFNVMLFEGVPVIKPEELEPQEGETHMVIETKDGKTQEIHRYRDVTMRWKGQMNLMILACENQDKIHYAMPVRIMLYDGLSYVQQMKHIWDLRDKDEEVDADEFLSRFHKEDKICPVLTLIFYFGEKEWDASLDLYGMFEMEELLRTNENLKKYIPNYTINLIDAVRLENLEAFQKDLRMVLGLLKCRKDKKVLRKYVTDNKDFFEKLDEETGLVIGEIIESKSVTRLIKQQKERGEVDMCKAMEDWAAEERAIGRSEILVELIRKKLEKGKNVSQIADEVEEPEEVVRQLIEDHKLFG